MKKTLYLFLALLLPALLFVFLKYAGKNEFNIPVYHENGVADQPTDCYMDYPSPYSLPDSVWQKGAKNQWKAALFVFPKPGLDIEKSKSRIEAELGAAEVAWLDPCKTSADCAHLKKCIFLVKDPWETVLVDRDGRIRGYYDLVSREEEDRLRVELKILLKRY